MPTQQQDQQHDLPQKHWSKSIAWTRLLIASVILLFVAIGIIIWMLTSGSAFTAILPIVIFTVLGILIALFQWLFPISSSTSEQPSAHQHTSVVHQGQPIIVPVHTMQPLPLSSPPTEKASYRGIVGLPPPTDPRTIQQREQVVREVNSKLIQPDITAIVFLESEELANPHLPLLFIAMLKNNDMFTLAHFWLSRSGLLLIPPPPLPTLLETFLKHSANLYSI